MKIGIHHQADSFSERWIQYCDKKQISHKLVNCYDSDIVQQLEDCDALMWHHNHTNYKDLLFAKQLLFSLEQAGKKVFPDFNTGWHFDDKIGQKYLLEAIGVPLVPSYVFYSKNEALEWIQKTFFPKVFKLRSGAGSANVQLVKTEKKAKKLISIAFGRGFPKVNETAGIKDRLQAYKKGKDTLWKKETFGKILKVAKRFFIDKKYLTRERGYAYFQDFIPNNSCDIRVIVIGQKAFAIKRLVRKNDFRASGSGEVVYHKNEIPEQCVQMAFDINKSIRSQCIGYDFIFDQHCRPLLVEIGYGFNTPVYDPCPGYWDSNMVWYEEQFNPQEWMIENLINDIQTKKKN